MSLLNNVHVLTGTLENNVAGTVEGGTVAAGTVVKIGPEWQKVANLSALVTVDCETNGMTMAGVWQVSDNGTDWVNATPGNNAANVTIATGTSGSDASVTVAIAAPNSVYAWKFARLALINGSQTGGATDTYSIGYCYRKLTGVERG